MMEYKQAIVIRSDLDISRGKTVAQGAHAALLACEAAGENVRRAWQGQGGKKVVLKVAGLKELQGLEARAREMGLPCALVQDAGLTEVEPGTVTALGIGPAPAGEIDRLTGNLKLL
ncbi:MAG: peptidyl-tRNA hydrolase [Euryarchaeota archaeon]|nr:peptidyl-tRNA hydrolase [Euryarchaeota archaeon]